MKNTIVKIGGRMLDLYPGTVITQSLKSFAIGEMADRFVNFTNKFRAPRTANNDAIYENCGSVDSETDVPYTQQLATIEQNGIDTVKEGIHIIDDADEDYNISILSGAKGFFQAIDGLMLSDLSGFAFRADDNYMADRRDATDDVIYPVGYFGTRTGAVPVYQDLPFIFLHSLFERIFEDAGYEVDWTPDSKFNKIVLSAYGDGAQYAKSFIERLRIEVFIETPQVIYLAGEYPIDFTGIEKAGDPDKSYWNGFSFIGSDPDLAAGDGLYYARYRYTISITVTGGTVNIGFGPTGDPTPDISAIGSGTYSFESDPQDTTNWVTAINGTGYSLFVTPNVVPIFSDTNFADWTNEGPEALTSFWMLASVAGWTYPNGDPMQPLYSAIARSPAFTPISIATPITGIVNIHSPTAFDGTLNIYLWDGTTSELIDSLPINIASGYINHSFAATTTQANNTNIEFEFVLNSGNSNIGITGVTISGSAISVTVNAGSLVIEPAGYYFNGLSGPTDFNYYAALAPDIKQSDLLKEIAIHYGLQFEENYGTVTLKRVDDTIGDRSNAKDWTQKRIKGNDSLKYVYQNYARKNYFRYKAAEELNNLYGQGVFDISNQNIDEETTVYDSLFENTSIRFESGFVFANVAVYDEADPADIFRKFDNGGGPKMLLIRDKYSYEPDVEYQDGNTYNDYKVVYFDDPLQDDTMKFQQDIDTNYPLFVACLQRAKIVERDYMLTELDIANFSFLVPIYDSGQYYLVNEIKDFIESGVKTRVELFKI